MAGAQRRAIFRADASSRIGGGHVMRCLTLAEHFIAADWSVGFACTAETLAIVPHLSDRAEVLEGLECRSLDMQALAGRWPSGCDVLVVDHYSLDARFEEACRGSAHRIVVIDDLANRPHDCDLLIDSTLARKAVDYDALVPAGALVLTGADYALLRPEFAEHREKALARRAGVEKVERILVSLGLTDMDGITERVTRAMLGIDAKFSIDVVIGSVAPSRAALEELAAREPRLCLNIDPLSMARLMAKAHLAVGAGGTTSWERCCLGLPTVLLILADNQRLVASKLEQAGAAVAVLSAPDPDIADVVAKVVRLVADAPSLRRMATAAASLVDGRGSERIVIAIHGLFASLDQSGGRVKVRAATLRDSQLVWAWRNDAISRANSRNSDLVAWDDHERWFAETLVNPDSLMLIGVVENEPIGVARFDRSTDAEFDVSINLAPEKRGAGLGTKLLATACAAVNEHMPRAALSAQIKTENLGSRRLFEACQFDLIAATDGLVAYRRPPPKQVAFRGRASSSRPTGHGKPRK